MGPYMNSSYSKSWILLCFWGGTAEAAFHEIANCFASFDFFHHLDIQTG